MQKKFAKSGLPRLSTSHENVRRSEASPVGDRIPGYGKCITEGFARTPLSGLCSPYRPGQSEESLGFYLTYTFWYITTEVLKRAENQHGYYREGFFIPFQPCQQRQESSKSVGLRNHKRIQRFTFNCFQGHSRNG
ncbi:hypothetical protein KIN20_033510 [Parelaphostrongylus tenuis]|uniref:Uncharacterized protein n=1 Tax=Parelaphostrongylus tenuis TaxID=148309 RepID=A0AAD5WIH3_PARTN|nr:hypothetical protein KIN20_033510 [Parelaphostrongylus tenuis]